MDWRNNCKRCLVASSIGKATMIVSATLAFLRPFLSCSVIQFRVLTRSVDIRLQKKLKGGDYSTIATYPHLLTTQTVNPTVWKLPPTSSSYSSYLDHT